MRAGDRSSGSAASTTSHTGTPAARERGGHGAALEIRAALGHHHARRESARCAARIASSTTRLADSVAIQDSGSVSSACACFTTDLVALTRSSRSAAHERARCVRSSTGGSPRRTPVSATSSARAASWWIERHRRLRALGVAQVPQQGLPQRGRGRRSVGRDPAFELFEKRAAHVGRAGSAIGSEVGHGTHLLMTFESHSEVDWRASVPSASVSGNAFGADLDAVLRVAALGEAAASHDRCAGAASRRAARGPCIEEQHVHDRRGPDVLGALVDLRAGFEAQAAARAACDRHRDIRRGLRRRRGAGCAPMSTAARCSEIMGSRSTIRSRITTNFAERLERDQVRSEIIHARGARRLSGRH